MAFRHYVGVERGLLWGLAVGTLACSSESYYEATPLSFEWDVAGLTSPRDELRRPRANLCAVALSCRRSIRGDVKIACALTIAEEQGLVYDGFAGVERRGRSSASFPKANYSFELRDEDGETELPTPVLGMGREEDWILDGMWADRSMMRNQLAYDIFASFGENRYAAEGRYCTLVLDGKYNGIYRLVERPKRDGSRIDIPKDDGSGSSFIVTQDPDGVLTFPLGLEEQWSLIYPNRRRATPAQVSAVQTWLDGLYRALRKRSKDGELFEYLERASLIDWILIQEFAKNIDAYKLSVYFYKAPQEPARMLPWDMDLAFGQPIVARGAPESPIAHESDGWVAERTPFIRDILATQGIAEALASRWRELRQGPLRSSAISRRLDEYEAAMRPELAANIERWPLNKVTFAGIYPPYEFPPRDSYAEESSALRLWIEERSTWMDAHIDEFTK